MRRSGVLANRGVRGLAAGARAGRTRRVLVGRRLGGRTGRRRTGQEAGQGGRGAFGLARGVPLGAGAARRPFAGRFGRSGLVARGVAARLDHRQRIAVALGPGLALAAIAVVAVLAGAAVAALPAVAAAVAGAIVALAAGLAFVAVARPVAVLAAVLGLLLLLLGRLGGGEGRGLGAGFVLEIDIEALAEGLAGGDVLHRALRLQGAQHAEIMLAVLQVVLGQHPVAGGKGVAGQLLVPLIDRLGVAADLDALGPGRIPRAVGIGAVLVAAAAGLAVASALPLHALEISHRTVPCVLGAPPAFGRTAGARMGRPVVRGQSPACALGKPFVSPVRGSGGARPLPVTNPPRETPGGKSARNDAIWWETGPDLASRRAVSKGILDPGDHPVPIAQVTDHLHGVGAGVA